MDAVTYPDEKVSDFLVENFIPVKIPFAHDREMVKRFNITWTPTFLVLDTEGREHYRFVGYLPPKDFIANLEFAKGKVFFDRNRLGMAIDIFQDVVDSFGESERAAESAYFLGVSRYKKSHDVEELKSGWRIIVDKYPKSEWAKKVSFLFG